MSNEIPYLDIKKHSRCHKMFLSVLPNKYQSEDSNKLAIAYFSLSSLKLMNTLESTFSESERKGFIEFIYLHLIVFDDISGFRGSFIYLKNDKNSIDIASTCFALQCLLILGDDLKRLNKFKILNFVKILQLSNGGFKNSINSNFENDVRYCMIATTICKILVNNFENFINLKNLQKFIYNLQNFDGGFSMFKGDESHCGMIFCAIDSLSLISSLSSSSSSSSSKLNFNKLIDFLTHRQISFNKFNELELENNEFSDINDIGGFNGRINKYGDTCYVFWVLGSLKLLGFLNLINKNLALNFLLNKTQNKTLGGFNKTTDPDELPDPLHSYLGLCALSLLNHPDLESLNTELVIPQSSYENYLKKRDEII